MWNLDTFDISRTSDRVFFSLLWGLIHSNWPAAGFLLLPCIHVCAQLCEHGMVLFVPNAFVSLCFCLLLYFIVCVFFLRVTLLPFFNSNKCHSICLVWFPAYGFLFILFTHNKVYGFFFHFKCLGWMWFAKLMIHKMCDIDTKLNLHSRTRTYSRTISHFKLTKLFQFDEDWLWKSKPHPD